MKKVFSLLIANIPAVLFGGAAVYMSLEGIKGWGWVLVLALLLGHTLKDLSDGSARLEEAEKLLKIWDIRWRKYQKDSRDKLEANPIPLDLCRTKTHNHFSKYGE